MPEPEKSEIIEESKEAANETFITSKDGQEGNLTMNQTLNVTMYTANDQSRIEPARD
jgi:hypothetical protein